MFRVRLRLSSAVLVLGAAVTGCGHDATPVSPSTTTASGLPSLIPASLVGPPTGTTIPLSNQPVTLVFKNASGVPSPIDLTEVVEVATDESFSSIALSKVVPTVSGTETSTVTLTPLPVGAYFWRVRATAVGAGSQVSSTLRFTVGADAPFEAPRLGTPADGALQKLFVTLGGGRPDVMPRGVWPLAWRFELAADPFFASMVATTTLPASLNYGVGWAVPQPLLVETTYYWRVVMIDPSSGGSRYSETRSFHTLPRTIDGLSALHITNACGWSLAFDGALRTTGDELQFDVGTGADPLTMRLTRSGTTVSGTLQGGAPERMTKGLPAQFFKQSVGPFSFTGSASLQGTVQPTGAITGTLDGVVYKYDPYSSILRCEKADTPWEFYPAGS